MFDITQHLTFSQQGRASCPCCEAEKGKPNTNLSLVPNTDGAYKCHRGCRPQDIRAALGNPKPSQIPAAIAQSQPAKKVTTSLQKVETACQRLLDQAPEAIEWLKNRGISRQMAVRYLLGITECRISQKRHRAITIPIPNRDGTAYYQKKRVAPWDTQAKELSGYQPWKQYGIPQRVYLTHSPDKAEQTWLCEGEWDAIKLGWELRNQKKIAVACFTCGAGNVPPDKELERLPGDVVIFYDRNDAPLKNGTLPGEAGAQKVAQAIHQLKRTAKIALVPMADDCQVKGWDVSDALNNGFKVKDFTAAAKAATDYAPTTHANPLKQRLKWNDDLLDRAPDYTEFLVPDLLTADELFLLAAGPRTGKSLMAMTLAHAVAAGEQFMGRPTTQGTVIYAKCEDNDTKIKEREMAQGWGRGLPVAWLDKFKLAELDHLRAITEDLDPRLIVLDTLSRIKDASISESSAEMSQLLEPLQELAKDMGCCIVLVHHTGKVSADNAADIDIFDTIRGSSAIRAVCRGSMIIAAAEQHYRLVCENGWGKHDLKIILDANTLKWKLLGNWQPQTNLSQQEQIVQYLAKVGEASVEQIHDATGIHKKCLYQQLARLQVSENTQEKVKKSGSRRSYSYSLAYSQHIQQLNSLLTSEDSPADGDRTPIQQKLLSSRESSDHLTNTEENASLVANGQSGPLRSSKSVDYKPSTPDTEGDFTSQHTSQQLVNTEENFDQLASNDTGRNFLPPSEAQNFDQSFQIADKVEILTGRFSGSQVFVWEVGEAKIKVRKDGWLVIRDYLPNQLRLINRDGFWDGVWVQNGKGEKYQLDGPQLHPTYLNGLKDGQPIKLKRSCHYLVGS